ncbi:MAG: 50S ribosomal protein L18 [Clostridiaceae bacterium]|jgi:large subunit ribosomal protein L18|nr:50S ribosomal protein L18 [Clostridiaceae bacterium]
MIKKIDRRAIRNRKHLRVRKKISGTAARPRLCVYRSLSNIYAQIVDDETATTLAAASTLDKDIREQGYGGNAKAAALVGKLLAERALEKQIESVVFDRGGYIYHGRIKSLAEAAREAGLKF